MPALITPAFVYWPRYLRREFFWDDAENKRRAVAHAKMLQQHNITTKELNGGIIPAAKGTRAQDHAHRGQYLEAWGQEQVRYIDLAYAHGFTVKSLRKYVNQYDESGAVSDRLSDRYCSTAR